MEKQAHWLNPATIITLTRLVLLPVIAVLYLGDFFPTAKLIAMILFVVAALTDFFDGWVARKFNMVTDLGKILDPIVDKALTFLGFVLIFTDGALLGVLFPVWFVVMVFFIATVRDYYTNMLKQLAAKHSGKAMAADWYAKIKSSVQFVGIAVSMFYAYRVINGLNIVAIIFLSLATLLSLLSAISYTRTYFKIKNLKIDNIDNG